MLCRQCLAGNNQSDGTEDEHATHGKTHCKDFAKYEYADADSRDWLKGSHDGSWRGTDIMHGDYHQYKRNYRWEYGEQ